MLDRLISFALQQRVFVLAAVVALVIAGWRALQDIPIEAFPDVEDVHVQIITLVPGQAPEEVERSVTQPIEIQMSGVPHLAQLRSVSMTGLSMVTLTFADHTDDYFARQQVLEKLQSVNLPPGIQPGLAPLSTAVGEIYRYVLDAPPSMALRDVRALQDWTVAPMLKRVPGVADVVSFGGAVKEYQVRINPLLLRKYNIPLDRVAQALGANSANTSGGLLTRGDESLVIRAVGLFQNTDDIGRVAVSSQGGKAVLVSDLGQVVVGDRTRNGIVAFNDRDDVVEGVVQMTKGQNPAKVIAELHQRVADANRLLPNGVKLLPFYDRTDLIRHTVHTVTENLLVGAVLVVAILIVFLRNWRAALIVASVIPLSLLFAFLMMDVRGVSANLISLGAVDFGIIIDSAVVLVEALMVRLALAQLDTTGSHHTTTWRLHTLKHTAVSLGHPILFAKAIIITAFLPIFTFERVEGRIFSPMALTLGFALLGAILLTLTLVPTLLSFSLRNEKMAERHSEWLHWLQERYRTLLGWAMPRARRILATSVLLLALSLALVPWLGSEFLPKLDEGNLWLTITLAPSASLERTKEIEREVRAILRSYPEVGNIATQTGRPDDGTDAKGPNNIEVLADLKPRSEWRFADKDAMIADMSRHIQAIPGVPTNFSQVIEDNVEEALSGVKGEIAVKIFGQDLDILEDKAEQVASVLHSVRGAADVAAIKIGGQTELDVALNRQRLAAYGLNVGDVDNTVQTALAGNAVNSFYEGDRRFDVTLRLDKPYRDSVDAVAGLPISLSAGGTIPLSTIADVALRQGAARISRESGERNVAVKVNLLGRDQGSFVSEAMLAVDRQVRLPPGYHLTWGGQFENQQRAMKRLGVIVPLSLMLIFVLLFWAFRSVRSAMLVLFMVPFTLIGGLAGLALAGLHLSVSAAVGFIAVAGISVQNGVIMVEQINEILRNGKTRAVAVVDGAVARLRPILMTALMGGLGLLPAALSHSIGSETQRPFAVVIVGGIASATMFTLLLLPLLFHNFSDASVD